MTRPEPLYFGPEGRPLFGWLHRAEAPRGVGLVIVAPFGYEAICAHRSLRHFAEAAARAGVPALRFDRDGTGDSAGDDRDPDRVSAWIASVHAAVSLLRAETGVARVCLLGARLGALLASLAASDRDDIAALVAVAPVVSGRAYARELRALQMALGLGPAPGGAQASVDEAIGFALTAETREALSKLDLLKTNARPPAPRVLVLDRDDLPTADRWADKLRGGGADVDLRRVPGYVEMVLDPHKAVVPAAMIEAATAWIAALDAGAAPPSAPSTRRASARLGDVIEAPSFIDDDATLFGIRSDPAAPPTRRRAILLLNAGAVPHVGPNRLHVALARRWAALGHLVLRLDLPGLGDSPPRVGAAENVVYAPRMPADVARVVASLRAERGVARVDAVGLCSGAYYALKAAVGGAALDGIVPINPLTFFWEEGMSLDYPEHHVTSEAERYGRSALDPEKWKKLLRGGVDVRAVAQIMVRRGAALIEHRARDLLRRAGRPLPDDLGAELEAVARRGIGLHFIFSAGDPGAELLRVQGGSSVPRLVARGALRVETIEGPDHTFTPLWSHEALVERLGAILDGPG